LFSHGSMLPGIPRPEAMRSHRCETLLI
jgi:hypothetical protein